MKLTIQINIEADTGAGDRPDLADFFAGLSNSFQSDYGYEEPTSDISVEFDPQTDYDPEGDLVPELMVNPEFHDDLPGWTAGKDMTFTSGQPESADSLEADPAPEAPAAPEPEAPTAPASDASLLTAKGLKLTKSTAISGGARVAAGDYVKTPSGEVLVKATARGWLEVETEDGNVILIEAEGAVSDEAPPPAEEPPSPETPTADDGIEDAEIISEQSSFTIADLRTLGRRVQELVSVDAVTAAVKSVVPDARRLGDVPEEHFGAVAAAFEQAIANAEARG